MIKTFVILKLLFIYLKFGLAIHFHEIIPKKKKKMYLAKDCIKQVSGGVITLPKLLLQCFCFHFERPIRCQAKSKYARTHCDNTLPGIF